MQLARLVGRYGWALLESFPTFGIGMIMALVHDAGHHFIFSGRLLQVLLLYGCFKFPTAEVSAVAASALTFGPSDNGVMESVVVFVVVQSAYGGSIFLIKAFTLAISDVASRRSC